MSRQKYDELYNFQLKFPFLTGRIKDNFLEAFTIEEILNIPEFTKIYDYTTDLYGYTKQLMFTEYSYRTWSSTLKNEDRLIKCTSDIGNVYINLLTTQKYFDKIRETKDYENIFKIFNLIYQNFPQFDICDPNSNIGDENKSTDDQIVYVDSMNYLMNKVIIPVLCDYFTQNATTKVLSKSYLMFDDLCNGTFDLINNIFKYYVKTGQRVYFKNNNSDISNKILTAITYLYNKMTIEEIELYRPLLIKNHEFFDFFHIEYNQKISIFNANASEEDKKAITETYTSAAKIKELCTSIASSFEKTGFDPSALSAMIDEAIINNKKIKDKKFPKEKYTIVYEVLKSLFTSTNEKSREFMDKSTFQIIIDTYADYFYDPYFLTGIVLKPTVLQDNYRDNVKNTKKLLSILFSKPNLEKYGSKFFTKYFDECRVPETDRVVKFKDSRKSFISYGFIKYLNSKYENVKDYLNLSDPIQLLYSIYLSSDFQEYFKSDLMITNDKVSDWRDGSYGWRTNELPVIHDMQNLFTSRSYYYDVEELLNDAFTVMLKYKNNLMTAPDRESYKDNEYQYSQNRSSYEYQKFISQLLILELCKYINKIKSDPSNTTNLATAARECNLSEFMNIPETSDFKECTLMIGEYYCNNRYWQLYQKHPDVQTAIDLDRGACAYYDFKSLIFNHRVYLSNKDCNIFNVKLADDSVFIPKFDRKYYGQVYKNGSYVYQNNPAADFSLNYLQKLDKDSIEFFKPIFMDNFNEPFGCDRSMKSVLFIVMLLAKGNSDYRDTFWRPNPSDKKLYKAELDEVIDFYQTYIFPLLETNGFMTEEDKENMRNILTQVRIDYQCYQTLV